MKKETLNFIQKYHMAEQGDGVIAGLSGGADSVCLLRILRCLRQELGIELRAVHVPVSYTHLPVDGGYLVK